jgi:hypothetical protein
MTIRIISSYVLASVGMVTLVASADEDTKEKVSRAKAAYTLETAKTRAEMIAVFEKQEEKARYDGNKNLLDEIKFHRKLFNDEEEWPASTPSNLTQRLTKAKAEFDKAMVTAIKECVKAKKDDDAAALEKELIEFRREALWPVLDLAQDKVDVKEEFIRVPPTKTLITTRKSYSGAVEITVVARTEAKNIRLYAHRGSCVIFNWESNTSELRVHRPDGKDNSGIWEGCTLATARVTPLKPNTFYTLKWRLTPEGMSVAVNGTVVFSEKKTYDLDTESKLGIGSWDSSVDIKEYRVTRLYTAK